MRFFFLLIFTLSIQAQPVNDLFSTQELEYINGKISISPFSGYKTFSVQKQQSAQGGEIFDIGTLNIRNIRLLEAIIAKGFKVNIYLQNKKNPFLIIGYDRVSKIFLGKNENIAFDKIKKQATWGGWGNFSNKRAGLYQVYVLPKKCSFKMLWHGPFRIRALSKFNASNLGKRKVKNKHFRDNVGPGTNTRVTLIGN